jgi:hypothetical protein
LKADCLIGVADLKVVKAVPDMLPELVGLEKWGFCGHRDPELLEELEGSADQSFVVVGVQCFK